MDSRRFDSLTRFLARRISRRTAVRGGTAGFAATLSVAARHQAAAAPTLRVEGGTGEYDDCLKWAYRDPFTEATGIQLVVAPEIDDYTRLKIEVETKQFNQSDVEGIASDIVQPPNGPQYLEPIDYSLVPQGEIVSGLAQPYGVASDTYAYVLGYNKTRTNGAAPEGWADFFDLQAFPGKRGVGDSPNDILVMALLADGVSPDELIPIDFDRAFTKLDTIKSELVFWNTGSQVQDLLDSGEVALAITFANRVASSSAKGKPVAMVWNGQMIQSDMHGVPKGDPQKSLAMQYIAFITSAAINGRISECIALGPANTKAQVNPEKAPDLATSHLDVPYVVMDSPTISGWFNQNADEVNERFQTWKSS